jgi:hypothetical protein
MSRRKKAAVLQYCQKKHDLPGWQAVSEGKLVAKKEGRYLPSSIKHAIFSGTTVKR